MTLSDKCILTFCRLGPAGLAPKAPGTCGTAVACLLAPLLFVPFSLPVRAGILVAVFFAGAWAATRAERILGRKDPGEVVIDELAGVWLVILPMANPHWWEIAAAFVLFRIFDIWKPWPVHASESWLPDGYGIMIDDVLAGCWALLCLSLVRMCV